jgi:hypothetical protein
MRYYRLLLVFAIAFSACQDDFQSADLPNRDENVYEDVPTQEQIGPPNDTNVTDLPDTVGDEPKPDVFSGDEDSSKVQTCQELVESIDFLCLEDGGCSSTAFGVDTQWLACTGVVPGLTWGEICHDMTPGSCTPDGDFNACYSNADCSGDQVCVKPKPSTAQDRGICRFMPVGGCWSDLDCAADQECAGVSICPKDVPCAADPFPGVCLPKSGDLGCWDNGDCEANQHCEGAELCVQGLCESKLGSCSGKIEPGCQRDSECPARMFCVGYTTGGHKGWCVTAPRVSGGDCWDHKQCEDDLESCLGARICAPDTLCYSWDMHPGVCGLFAQDGQGLQVTFSFPDEGVPEAILINRTSTPILFDPRYVVSLQMMVNAQWPDPPIPVGYFYDANWPLDAPEMLMRLSSGEALVLKGDSGLEYRMYQGTVRPEVIYLLGCEPGKTATACNTENRVFIGPEFELK